MYEGVQTIGPWSYKTLNRRRRDSHSVLDSWEQYSGGRGMCGQCPYRYQKEHLVYIRPADIKNINTVNGVHFS